MKHLSLSRVLKRPIRPRQRYNVAVRTRRYNDHLDKETYKPSTEMTNFETKHCFNHGRNIKIDVASVIAKLKTQE